MIVEFEPNGRIFHIVSDPVPAEARTIYLAKGEGVLSFEPEPGPLVPSILPDGQPELDEDGNPVMIPDGYRSKQVNILTDYVLDGEVVPRPTFDEIPDEITITADAEEVVTISIPDPCAIMIDGNPQTITGGVLEIQSDMPGEYLVEFVQWPYMPKTMKVIANDPTD